jgi:hypothetical protein
VLIHKFLHHERVCDFLPIKFWQPASQDIELHCAPDLSAVERTGCIWSEPENTYFLPFKDVAAELRSVSWALRCVLQNQSKATTPPDPAAFAQHIKYQVTAGELPFSCLQSG